LFYAFAPDLVVALVALVVLGGAYMGTLTGLNTSVQVHAPRAERSRILALYTLSLSIFYPLGAFVQADLAKSFGVRDVTAVGALVLGAIVVVIRLGAPGYWRAMGSTPTQSPVLLAD
jgi:predicted MFS family arabinose efflux permease